MDSIDNTLRAVDLFSGIGGSSCGAKCAGVQIVAAVDAWDIACEAYADNNPSAKVYNSACEKVSPGSIAREFGKIDLLLASPECTSHTCAKGAGERSENSRATAFQVLRFARALKPRWIVVENVIHMRAWNRYKELLSTLNDLGYRSRPQILNSADFGVPQSRRRLFIVCEMGRHPRETFPPPSLSRMSAHTIIDPNGTYAYTPLTKKGRAEATIARAERAITQVGSTKPFLIVYYGSDGSGGWQPVSSPLRTITTLDRFAYVRRRNGAHEMRMLQVPELKLAMGFPQDYIVERGTRRDKIKLLGNAVCPPVMEFVVRTLTRQVETAQFSAPTRQKGED